jgi:hypothetical protein
MVLKKSWILSKCVNLYKGRIPDQIAISGFAAQVHPVYAFTNDLYPGFL